VHVLINRTDALGDTVLTLPMATMLKKNFEDVQVAFLVSPISYPLFQETPYVDKVFVYNKKSNIFKRLRTLYKVFRVFRPEKFFHVGGSLLPSFFAFFMRVPFRAGLMNKWPTFLTLNHGLNQHRSFVSMHESEYNLNLLEVLSLTYSATDLINYPPIVNVLPEETKEAMEKFEFNLKKEGIEVSRLTKKEQVQKKKLIFFHPGMTGHTLNWSSRNYGRLVARMIEAYGDEYIYVISFTPSDKKYLEGLKDHMSKTPGDFYDKNVYFFNGAEDGLRHYMSILKTASLFVGPSTGPLHIANVLGVKTLGIYSPIKAQSVKRWEPFFKVEGKNKVVIPEVVCGEQKRCIGKECPYYECMALIEVEDVFNEASKFLASESQ
jgi:heptosyltransferase III